MNIADREALVAYDVIAGKSGLVHFPVPWSRASETSFLATPDAMKSALEQTGFKIVAWERPLTLRKATSTVPIVFVVVFRRQPLGATSWK